ncbi:MAG: MAPEG family protein [Burkholderiaceae bacterium]|nr:MAPEG family protein [Burkholderiaceae bacterium]
MTPTNPLLAPLVALIAWSMVMWLWMYVTRLPAMRRARMKPDSNAPRGEQMNQLPPEVRWKADNYNHLMEQPTLYYAVVLALVLAGGGSGAEVALAWAYTGLRVVHSLVQALINRIEVRFVLFILSSLALIGLIVAAAQRVF